jgi:hypothetical protein
MGEESIKEDIWTSGEQGMWRIGTNQELRGLNEDLNTVAEIKKKILDHGRVVKSKLGRRKRRKVPRLRRL